MSDFTVMVVALILLAGIAFLASRMEATAKLKHDLLRDEILRIKALSGPESVIPPEFIVRISLTGYTCLPTGLNTDGLIDITTIGQRWRVYLDENTGKIHDGAKYWEYLQKITSGATNA